jgi:uncharacterized membrane protein YdbT with pleckstrin-like domain
METKEETLWQGSQSQVLNFGTHISMLIITAIIAVLGIMFFPPLAAAAVIPLAYMFYKWLRIRTNRYKITTERIFFTSGIFSKKTDALELYRVRDIDMYEPFWQRIFKLGNIEIDSSDQSNPKFYLKAIPNPQKILDDIRKHVEARRDVKRVRGVEFMGDENLENT